MIKVNPTNKTRERKTTKNSLNGQVQIQIPKAKAEEYGYEYSWLKKGKVKHDETLADRDELKIIRTYQTIVRGIIQYFCLANNLTVLTHLNYLAEYSCLKTLARKRKRQLPKFERKVKLVQLGRFLILIKGKPNTNHGMFTLGTKLKKCVTIRETRTLP
ncbi:group II intron reverse transcriptase/maturase [Candidatus Phytoplasma fabacearum]|uniref:group II intron reverse transcriptase/maturase n=1 Tax=Candidatus Phytoplasma fabacearum TaxID=2982628 RepID=UPI002712D27D|nr:hypothetical protein ['Bituminaria bituminosa' little leaf phytoplasma]